MGSTSHSLAGAACCVVVWMALDYCWSQDFNIYFGVFNPTLIQSMKTIA